MSILISCQGERACKEHKSQWTEEELIMVEHMQVMSHSSGMRGELIVVSHAIS